jgi:spore maturation protein CgeB
VFFALARRNRRDRSLSCANLRIVVVDSYYPAFLAEHYASTPGLSHRPYEDQLESLLGECFGTSDAYSRHLSALGCDAVETIANCEPLQLRWAQEHGRGRWLLKRVSDVAYGRAAQIARILLLRRIAIEQIRSYQPDVVYMQDPAFFGASDLRVLRRHCRLLVGQIASSLPGWQRLRPFDLITTSFPHYVELLHTRGIEAEYFRIGFDERVLGRLHERGINCDPAGERPHVITFIGGLNPGVHGAGTRLLERLADEVEIDIWGYGAEALRPDSPILRRYRGYAWGLQMYEILARSKLALNRHIDAADGYANNMRLYEARRRPLAD